MARYVDGFVFPVPRGRLDEYRRLARFAGKVWREHGALEYVECIADAAAPEDLAIIAEGVSSFGRAQARDGHARPLSCLVRDGPRIVAGGSGRTEYRRLHVGYLWVAEALRGQGIGSRVLAEMEAEAARRGCRDAMIETMDESVARLYSRLGYHRVAYVPGYVGPFNRHTMLKRLIETQQT